MNTVNERGIEMKKIFRGLIVLSLILLASLTAVGFQVASGDVVVVQKGDVIEKNYTFAGSYFEHNGIIKGNLYVAGDNIVIDGEVMGNVFVAGTNIVINGFVTGDVYAIGQEIVINGEVTGNVFGAGNRLTSTWASKIGQDIFMAGSTI
jgi:cytoskeletal protein CcmA (bactofilin family)